MHLLPTSTTCGVLDNLVISSLNIILKSLFDLLLIPIAVHIHFQDSRDHATGALFSTFLSPSLVSQGKFFESRPMLPLSRQYVQSLVLGAIGTPIGLLRQITDQLAPFEDGIGAKQESRSSNVARARTPSVPAAFRFSVSFTIPMLKTVFPCY